LKSIFEGFEGFEETDHEGFEGSKGTDHEGTRP